MTEVNSAPDQEPVTVLNRLKRRRQDQQAIQPVAEVDNTLESLKAELGRYPKTKRHSAIVLDEAIDEALTRYCKQNQITVELFLEAAWVKASVQPSLLSDLLQEARKRYLDRKQVGKLKRLITMLGQPSSDPPSQ